jgi:hypothetical protein
MQTIAQTQDTASELVPAAPDFLEGYVSEEEYARRRGVTVRTCQRDRQLRKSPPYIQLGRRIYYRLEAVRTWLVNNERADDLAAPQSAVRRRGWARRRS